jgi:GTP-binding protein
LRLPIGMSFFRAGMRDPSRTGGKMDTDEEQRATRENADALFRQPCAFVKGVVDVSGLPAEAIPEVAFAGRSNVGKSSLLNALIGNKGLARTSNTPGRTRELNYFLLGDALHVVDMPGYGYARASKSLVRGWNDLIRDYLRGRTQLKRVFLLIDSRHGVKENDKATMELMDKSAMSYQLVLTKIDKLKPSEVAGVVEAAKVAAAKHGAAYPEVIATSAEKKQGIDELRLAVARSLG